LAIYNYYPERYTIQEIKLSRVGILYQDMKEHNKNLILDHVFFLCQRLILVILLLFEVDYFSFTKHSLTRGEIQLIIFVGCCILFCIWKVIWRPYNSVVLNIQDISFELFFTTIIIIYFKFNSIKSQLVSTGVAHRYGLACVILVYMMVAINMIVSLYFWIQRLKQCKQRKVIKKQLPIPIIPKLDLNITSKVLMKEEQKDETMSKSTKKTLYDWDIKKHIKESKVDIDDHFDIDEEVINRHSIVENSSKIIKEVNRDWFTNKKEDGTDQIFMNQNNDDTIFDSQIEKQVLEPLEEVKEVEEVEEVKEEPLEEDKDDRIRRLLNKYKTNEVKGENVKLM